MMKKEKRKKRRRRKKEEGEGKEMKENSCGIPSMLSFSPPTTSGMARKALYRDTIDTSPTLSEQGVYIRNR